jgi:hypothetical protein
MRPELHALKIDLFLRQQGLDTTTPAGKAMFQMMGVFAEFERAMIAERVRAGLARARSEGKRLGRPPIPAKLENAIREALNKPGRPGVRQIAERFGVDPGTVQRISRPRPFADGAASGHQARATGDKGRDQSLSACYRIWKARGRPASRCTSSTVDVLALRYPSNGTVVTV